MWNPVPRRNMAAVYGRMSNLRARRNPLPESPEFSFNYRLSTR
jgi:hypothetical protein